MTTITSKAKPRWTLWTDRRGRNRASFPWRTQEEQEIDKNGLSAWERIGYFGAYQSAYTDALSMARLRLESRGYDPDLAEVLLLRSAWPDETFDTP